MLRILGLIPHRVKILGKHLGLIRIYGVLLDKYTAELAFQTRWAKAYRDNSAQLEKDLEGFWKEYRCLDKIREFCLIDDGSVVLDVGCGIATVLHVLKGKRYGIDPLAKEYLKMYNYPSGISVVKSGGEKIPFGDKYFDFVFCSNVLDHVTDPSLTVGEVRRVLKPGGFFILVVEVFGEAVKRDPAHPHCFTEKEVRNLVYEGFDPIHLELRPWHSNVPGEEGLVAILRRT